MGCDKRESVLEYAQNGQIQILLLIHKVSSGLLLTTHTLYSSQWFLLADSESPDHIANAQADLGLRCLHMPKDNDF